MKSSGMLKHFFFAFLIAIAVYAVSYYGIEHSRTKNGPWQITFTNEAATPTLIINEPQHDITNLKIIFPRESSTNEALTLTFDQPREWPFDVPFGQ